MWVLTSKKNGDIYYLLPEKEKHSVGRSNADLILTGDSSISRTHVYLYPGKDSLKAIDVGSKYGSYYNENIEDKVAIHKNIPVELKTGDRIKFGILENEWVVSKINLCTLTSTLSHEDKEELMKSLKALGGRIIDKWDKCCTHLTMSKITVTHKVLQALVENIPIVSIEFWSKYLANLKSENKITDPANFLPECAETFINRENVTFGLVTERKTLFNGKTFVFMSSNPFEKYKPIIESAGGACETLYKGVTKSTLVKKNVIVIRGSALTQTQCSQTVDSINDYMKTKGRRLVPDAEIGLAIIHCDITKYCNPQYNMVNEFAAETNDVIPHSNIIAKQTPAFKTESMEKDVIEVPESILYDATENFKSDKLDDEEDDIALVACTEKFMKNQNTVKTTELPREESPSTSTKRKRTSSGEPSKSNKKLNAEYFGVEETNDSASTSTTLSQHLAIESSSQLLHAQQNSARTPEPSTSRKRISRFAMDKSNFTDMDQIKRSKTSEGNQDESQSLQSSSEQRKRKAKVAIICSDGEDDDLFAFESSATQKKKKTNERETRLSKASSQKSEEMPIPQQNITKQHKSSADTVNANIPRTKIPFPLPSEAWLSKSMIGMKIESEDGKENMVKQESPETTAWLGSLKGGFEVRVKEMKLVCRSLRDKYADAGHSQASSTSNGKNFKAFVKKRNYKPQTTIISTVPIYVGVKQSGDF